MPEFTGFPRQAVTFLRDLESNNDRDWFKANRGRYDEYLAAPALALGRDLQRFGTVRLFRPYNDARFHARPPIKEHIGIPFGIEGATGFYAELSLDGLLVAGGLYRSQPDQVARLREAVADGRRGGALSRALAKARAGGLDLGEPDLERVPRGHDADHPRADLLRRRRVVLSHRETEAAEVGCTPRRPGERIAAWFEAAKPDGHVLRTATSVLAGAPEADADGPDSVKSGTGEQPSPRRSQVPDHREERLDDRRTAHPGGMRTRARYVGAGPTMSR